VGKPISKMGVGDVAYGIAAQAIEEKWVAARLGPHIARFAIDYAAEQSDTLAAEKYMLEAQEMAEKAAQPLQQIFERVSQLWSHVSLDSPVELELHEIAKLAQDGLRYLAGAAKPEAQVDFTTWFCKAHLPTQSHATGTCFVCNALAAPPPRASLPVRKCPKCGNPEGDGLRDYGEERHSMYCPKCGYTGDGR